MFRRNLTALVAAAFCSSIALSSPAPVTPSPAPSSQSGSARIQSVVPGAYNRALQNPLKGFTAESNGSHEWATLSHKYIRWNELEDDVSHGMARILAVTDQKFGGAREHNIKVIPRVYLHWAAPHEKYWPADMMTDDYTSPQFQARVTRLIERLGVAWNNDPRVAFVEVGIFGKWGEHHSPDPTLQLQTLVGNALQAAFPDKLVSVRHMWEEFQGFGFGEYWDSFAHHQQTWGHGSEIAAVNHVDQRYLSTYIGGEVAYNWGSSDIQPGDSPTDSVSDPFHRDFIENSIRWLHCTQLRWIANYDQSDPVARAGAEILQRAMGYRFTLDKAAFTRSIQDDGKLSFSAAVTNEGSAPFYYDWPVQLALHDPVTRDVVWSTTLSGVDITAWAPGSQWTEPEWEPLGNWPGTAASNAWSSAAHEWAMQPKTNTVNVEVPVTAPAGEYVLSLSILDPANMRPNLRFATSHYWDGGWHPLGLVAVGQSGGGPLPAGTVFDDPLADTTIEY